MIRGGAVTLLSSDPARAVRFYIETLGMKLLEERPSASVIDAGEGFRIEIRQGGRGDARGTIALGLFPKLPIDEAIAILENRGVTFRVEDTDEATVAHFEDLDGTALYLRQDKKR